MLMEVKLQVNGNEILLQKFAQKIWRGVIIGIVKELKGAPDDIREVKLQIKL
jgi:hypothetical protein